MIVTVASFRGHYAEFADLNQFLDTTISYWLMIAGQLVNSARWGTLTEVGVELFTAHNLVLETQARQNAENGSLPGINTGPVNNMSVDKVSVGYDTASGIEADAGHWNTTVYGTRFIRLLRMMGAGGVQLGAGGCVADPLSSANAWAGPWISNFPNPTG